MTNADCPIRVLVANLPAMLVEIVAHEIEQQKDMEIVGVIEGNMNLLRAAGHGVDVVILGTESLDSPPGICSHLLSEYPSLKIIALVAQSDQAAGYWLDIHTQQLNNVNAESLIVGIRSLSARVPGV